MLICNSFIVWKKETIQSGIPSTFSSLQKSFSVEDILKKVEIQDLTLTSDRSVVG